MRYLHTMIRVTDLERSIRFYTQALGFEVVRRNDYADDKFTLVFLKAPSEEPPEPLLELTYNWGVNQYERGGAYGHMAYAVDSIDEIRKRLQANGHDLSWGPGSTPDGKKKMAFIDDPDGYEIELIESH